MARPDRRFDLAVEAAVAAVLGAASLPLARLFKPGPLGWIVLASLAASLVVASASRRLRLPPLAAWSVSILTLVWFLGLLFFRETLFGPFPSWATLQAIGDAVRAGAQQTINEIAPVEATEPLLMLVAAGVWITTWLVDAAATWVRNPLLAVASAIPLFVLPGAILESERLGTEVVLFLASACVLLFLDGRRQMRRWAPSGTRANAGWRIGPAVRIGVTGAALTALLTPLVPGYGAPPGFGGAGGSNDRVLFNPIVAIRPALDSDLVQTLFTVEANRPTYYRLTTLEFFNGEEWRQGGERVLESFSAAPPLVLAPSAGVTQTITIGALAGPWLPAAYVPLSMRGASADIETETSALLVDGELYPGMRYEVESQVPRPSQASLDREWDYDEEQMAQYLLLPDVPQPVVDLTDRITEGLDTPYQKAVAIQRHLRSFTYNEDVALEHSYDDLVTFLTEVKEGYCEQFASSMAVMARLEGIPARVAIGFGVGQQSDIEDFYTVTTREAHAWVELWFPNAGWLAFEPTPRAGVARVPSYAIPSTDPVDPGPTDEPTSDPTDDPTSRPTDRPSDPTDPTASPSGRGTPAPVRTLGILGIVLAAAAFLAPLAALVHRRLAVRARPSRPPREVATARYADFLDWCHAAGLARAPAETPREHAGRLVRVAGGASEPLGRLAELAEEALWAPPNGLDPAEVGEAAARAREALEPTLGRGRRLRTALRWGPRLRG